MNPGVLIIISCILCSFISSAGMMFCRSKGDDKDEAKAKANTKRCTTTTTIASFINGFICIFVLLKLFQVF